MTCFTKLSERELSTILEEKDAERATKFRGYLQAKARIEQSRPIEIKS